MPFVLQAQSPDKLIENGKYDEAIEKCVDRLSKDKGNTTALYSSLKRAYETANALDLEKIKTLKMSGGPDIWYDVFTGYYSIQQRYVLVSGIKEKLEADMVNIKLLEYPEDLEVSRQNAGAFLYATAMKNINTGTREGAMEAYSDLIKITRLFEEYKDVELRMRQALGTAAKTALLEVKNSSEAALPPDFLSSMEAIPLTLREKGFLNYKSKAEPGESFSLILQVEIMDITVSPGTVSKREYTSSHKAPETFESEYKDEKKKAEDKNHPDYNKCVITEIYQLKNATMKAKLRYKEGSTGKVLYVVPIKALTSFENKTATATGDMYACPPEVYEILDKPKKKFPKNAEMIYQLSDEFKVLIKEIVWNDSFIEN